MNLAENKFLIGFGAAMLICVGGLGYYAVKEKGRYSEAVSAYNTKSDAYVSLQTAPIYPDQENLEKLKARETEVGEVAKRLEEDLQKLSIPLEEVSPDQFQDILRRSVDGVLAKAKEKNIKLPEQFYLGFNQYQAQPPKSTAAPALLRQLRAIELAVHTLLDHNISVLQSLSRDPVPEEGDAKGSATPPSKRTQANAKATPAPAAAAPAGLQFAKQAFHLEFVSTQPAFRESLNAISGNQKQLFIVRSLSVANEKLSPLAKDVPAAVQPVNLVQEESTETKAAPATFQYVLGAEKLTVKMKVEQVVFPTPNSK